MSMLRESAFKRLRPVCVRLSQSSLQLRAGGKLDVKELSPILDTLHAVLGDVDELDDALCDYVLFPILPLFRQASSLPSSVVAVALQCLRLLLEKGRSITAKPEITGQLLILFMNLLQQQTSLLPKQNASEQLVLAVCQCLESLLSRGQPTFPDSPSPGTEPRLVITGNLLADLLSVAVADQVAAARLPSLTAIDLLLSHEERVDVVRRFLPGVLSKLAKPMFTSSTKRTSYKALIASLKILAGVLPRAFDHKGTTDSKKGDGETSSEDQWIATNLPHVRLVLQNVAKLSTHQRTEVRAALFDLCQGLLRRKTLQTDAKFFLNCCLEISGNGDMGKEEEKLVGLLLERGDLSDLFFQSATSTLQNLSSKMQSADASKREEAANKAKSCVSLASELPLGLNDLSDLLAESLLDCVLLLDASSKKTTILQDVGSTDEWSLTLKEEARLDEIFSQKPGAQADAAILKDLIATVMNTRYAGPVLDYLSNSGQTLYGQLGLARMWSLATCFEVVQQSDLAKKVHANDALIARKDLALASAYDISLSLLDKAPLAGDWRLQALSLDTIANYALASGPEYRPELSFALYPVVERVACQDERLRRHAARALQKIAMACGYNQVQDILLQNADYLINAVSIRLTDLEPRPEAGRVLQAAIKIGGASMLPHLGDITECIFSVLDSYHGYPTMVDSMFSVLGAMIDQAPVRGQIHPHGEPLLKPSGAASINECIEQIRKIGRPQELKLEDILDEEIIGDEVGNLEADEGKEVDKAISASEKAVTKTVERIIRYGQYYLTYETPQVRRGLLDVLQTGLVALRHDEDTLLPVINDIWPVLVSRIYDPEPYVSVSALEALATTISSAGDFMSSRVEDEWERLRRFIVQHRPKMRSDGKSKTTAVASAGDLTYTSSGRVWKAILKTVAAIIKHVRITAGMEEAMFALFAQHLSENHDLYEALKLLNPDTLWLIEEKARISRGIAPERPAAPVLEGFQFAPLPI